MLLTLTLCLFLFSKQIAVTQVQTINQGHPHSSSNFMTYEDEDILEKFYTTHQIRLERKELWSVYSVKFVL
jgi:hypothetical protein